MKVFNGLKPSLVWGYFEEICSIPRPSKKEEQIIEYLMAFAAKNGLEAKKDEAGNVLITKPASKGKDHIKPIVLQSHIDMVCEKNSDVIFDFDHDPILPYIDGEWVKAKGTTLGADDGIGIAAQLAILAAGDLEHGPVECLFTVDEETGLSGAFALKEGFFTGKTLLNLDSEDEGELFIGCAGGIDTVATLSYEHKKVPPQSVSFRIAVSGLKGGHSGDDIDKGLGNSNKILNRFIWQAANNYHLRMSDFDGGNLRNAIPREAFANVSIPAKNEKKFIDDFTVFAQKVKIELTATEPEIKFSMGRVPNPEFVLNSNTQHGLLNSLYACPHGVIAWSAAIKGLVETSTNLASVKFDKEKREIIITTSQRSSVEWAKREIANTVESVFRLADAKVEHSAGYPGWTPDIKSEILAITRNTYKKLFNVEPKVKAIHAGLECGLFLEKYPGLDMISFGPTLRGVHSPDERLQIGTVEKFWELLVGVLREMSNR